MNTRILDYYLPQKSKEREKLRGCLSKYVLLFYLPVLRSSLRCVPAGSSFLQMCAYLHPYLTNLYSLLGFQLKCLSLNLPNPLLQTQLSTLVIVPAAS